MENKFNILNNKLIEHYHCFNTERFYLDEVNKDFISIVSGIEDSCPVHLCKNIAKFTYKLARKLNLTPIHIYVGAWAFNTRMFERK